MIVETTTVTRSHKGKLNIIFIYTRIIKKKKHFKNGIVVFRDIKTEKAQKQDWDGTLAIILN